MIVKLNVPATVGVPEIVAGPGVSVVGLRFSPSGSAPELME
jgi:hypothetical protein